MSSEILSANQLPSYDDEEIQLMDTEANNLQLEEEEEEEKAEVEVDSKENERSPTPPTEQRKSSSFSIRDKIKVYIRDGPKKHHVESVPYDDNYYDLPTAEQLATVDLNEEKVKEIFTSLNLTEEDFKSSSSPFGLSRPESLFIRGVNNMSTQEILDYFEDFQPTGIAWISDQTCNIFWRETLTPLNLLAKISTVSQRNSGKRKYSDLSSEIALPSGHWRRLEFPATDSTKNPLQLFVRYTTVDDRKVRGAENHSEYYRQHGNPNYNNMTGLISRSKKRALNAMRTDRYSDLTITKTNDGSTNSTFIDDETTPTTEENADDPNVKFTVVLPPKKEENNDVGEEEQEDQQRTKRRRGNPNLNDEDEKTHFTVTIESLNKQRKHVEDRSRESSKFDSPRKSSSNPHDGADDDDNHHERPKVLDAREILERKRRSRK